MPAGSRGSKGSSSSRKPRLLATAGYLLVLVGAAAPGSPPAGGEVDRQEAIESGAATRPAAAETGQEIPFTLLALSPSTRKGVIQLEDDELVVVEIGTEIPGTALQVLEVLDGRLVLVSEAGGKGAERGPWLVWVEVARELGEASRTTWFRRVDDSWRPMSGPTPPEAEPSEDGSGDRSTSSPEEGSSP